MATLAGSIPLSITTVAPKKVGVVSVPVMAALVILMGSSVLLFARLGTYSLWTDEASTAITAAGVWRTGDTSAWLDDHNLLTYRDGLLLNHQKDRYTSPLQFYVVAPFIGLLGHSSFACRLPMAICGLGTVLVMLRWMRRARLANAVWVAAAGIVLTNASFFLFQRQCRYFALATFLSTLVAYLYCNWDGSRRRLFGVAVVMSLLLSSQYLDYAAVVGCLLVDYGIWGRRRRAIRGLNWLILIVPQLITAMVVCRIWNPIERAASVVAVNSSKSHEIAATTSQVWVSGFAKLYWWNVRDMIACDFVILPLVVLCPILYFVWVPRGLGGFLVAEAARPVGGVGGRDSVGMRISAGSSWLLRAPVALMMFIAGVTFFTAHPLPAEGNAEVRYLAPILPLCVGISVLAAWGLLGDAGLEGAGRLLRRAGLLLVFLLAAFCVVGPGSTARAYYRELLHPAVEPYAPVSTWINQNVRAGSTVYVAPDMCVSPLMWHASKATYVWQLSDPPRADYAGLRDIYFKNRVAPDYLIGFGPDLSGIRECEELFAGRGILYQPVATIPVYYKEMFRPEIIWRSFETVEAKGGEQVYIFRRE